MQLRERSFVVLMSPPAKEAPNISILSVRKEEGCGNHRFQSAISALRRIFNASLMPQEQGDRVGVAGALI